jgi:galactokinase
LTASLLGIFQDTFGAAATHLSRAPGRVNLIGEHTDYNDLPVLPMALQRDVKIAARPRADGAVRLNNERGEFSPVEFYLEETIGPGPPGDWGNYVKAPALELVRRFSIRRGLDGVVASSVPVASGLSSSSALVNAVGLALLKINEVPLGTLEAADIMAEAERFTGTRGGGMDQAISMAARAGHAARIDFAPLRLDHVSIPDDWAFVVADTGVRAEKSGAARDAYNLRRSQCELAFERLTAVLVGDGVIPSGLSGYPALIDALGYDGALSAGAEVLDGDVLRRFRHVVSEARRVDRACAALRAEDLPLFGSLMDASHLSLSEDYEVSIPALDRVVGLARDGGAVGARLTGAGFGGCTVALAPRGAVGDVLSAIREGYHLARAVPGDSEDQVFVATPSPGATWEPVTGFPRGGAPS